MNTPVNFEIAKLLKEKKFDELCDKKYIARCLWRSLNIKKQYKNSEIHQNSSDVSAPTIGDVVMWLYEKHGIWITPEMISKIGDNTPNFYGRIRFFEDEFIHQENTKNFNSPTEAYEAGIEYTLKNLIK